MLLTRLEGVLLIVAVALFVPTRLHTTLTDSGQLYRAPFSEELAHDVRSVDALVRTARLEAPASEQQASTFFALEDSIRQRFIHGYAYYSLADNWMVALMGMVWTDAAAIVQPDEILQHSHAACSQEAIVMMAACRKLGLHYRPVSFEHHYAMEVEVDGRWVFVDTNLDPEFPPGPRRSAREYLDEGALRSMYASRLSPAEYEYTIGDHAQPGMVDTPPARRMAWLHAVTAPLSRWAWALTLMLAVALWVRRRVSLRGPSTKSVAADEQGRAAKRSTAV